MRLWGSDFNDIQIFLATKVKNRIPDWPYANNGPFESLLGLPWLLHFFLALITKLSTCNILPMINSWILWTLSFVGIESKRKLGLLSTQGKGYRIDNAVLRQPAKCFQQIVFKLRGIFLVSWQALLRAPWRQTSLILLEIKALLGTSRIALETDRPCTK